MTHQTAITVRVIAPSAETDTAVRKWERRLKTALKTAIAAMTFAMMAKMGGHTITRTGVCAGTIVEQEDAETATASKVIGMITSMAYIQKLQMQKTITIARQIVFAEMGPVNKVYMMSEVEILRGPIIFTNNQATARWIVQV
jgi:hypothetical protein